jgi:hypothetical protein
LESQENLMTWINHYKDTIGQIRCIPGTEQSPEILIRTWQAYMGGLHLTRGYHVVDELIRKLVDPLGEYSPPPGDPRIPPTGRQPPGSTVRELDSNIRHIYQSLCKYSKQSRRPRSIHRLPQYVRGATQHEGRIRAVGITSNKSENI